MFARNVCFVLVVARLCQAFYVPGVAPEDYKEGDPVEIKVASELKNYIFCRLLFKCMYNSKLIDNRLMITGC